MLEAQLKPWRCNSLEKFVSFLRAINVGGRNVIKMDLLKKIYADMGLQTPISYLQSGNVIFEVEPTGEVALAAEIESKIEAIADFRPDVHLRTSSELSAVIHANPFTGPAKSDASHLVVMFLRKPPTKSAADDLMQANTGPEEFELIGRDVYINYPNGIGRSKFTNAIIEKALGLQGTVRNWNTVTKLNQLMSD